MLGIGLRLELLKLKQIRSALEIPGAENTSLLVQTKLNLTYFGKTGFGSFLAYASGNCKANLNSFPKLT